MTGFTTRPRTSCDIRLPKRVLLILAFLGLSATTAFAISSPIVSARYGRLFLGGNRIQGPYELTYVSGELAVNGWSLPIPKIAKPKYSDREIAMGGFMDSVGDTAAALERRGVAVSKIRDTLVAMCRSSGLIDSVDARGDIVSWRFKYGPRSQIQLARPTVPNVPPVDPEVIQRRSLEHLKDLLERGTTLFIMSRGSMLITPSSAHIDSLIDRVLSGAPLSQDDKATLPSELRAQLRSPEKLIRVKRLQ